MHGDIFNKIVRYEGDDLTNLEYSVLTAMASFQSAEYTPSLDDPKRHVFASQETLARSARLSVRSVKRALKSAEEKGFIKECGYHGHVKCYAFLPDKLGFSTESIFNRKAKREISALPGTNGANALQPRAPGPDHPPVQNEPPDDFPEMDEPPMEETCPMADSSNVLPFPTSDYDGQADIPAIMPPESARWNAETIVQVACAIGGYTVSGHELAREREAAQQLLTMPLSNNNYQPLDRALFESIYRFEWERGELAERFMHPLRLADFARNPNTPDMAIKFYRQRQVEKERKEALDMMTPEQRFLLTCEKNGDTANPAYKRLKGIAQEPALTYAPRPSNRPAPRGQRAAVSAGGFERAGGGFDWLDAQVRYCTHQSYDQIHTAAIGRGYTGEQVADTFKKYRPGELPIGEEEQKES